MTPFSWANRAASNSQTEAFRDETRIMVGKLINFILHERFLVVALSIVLLLGGLFAFKYLNIEAYPDPAPPIIEILAQNPGWSAEEMERQITVPLETQLNGMPGIDVCGTPMDFCGYRKRAGSEAATPLLTPCAARPFPAARAGWCTAPK